MDSSASPTETGLPGSVWSDHGGAERGAGAAEEEEEEEDAEGAKPLTACLAL